MDTFGRLPNDVLNKIDNLYHKPNIKLIQTHGPGGGILFKIRIEYSYVACEFDLILSKGYQQKGYQQKVDILKQFIDRLERNESVVYCYENEYQFNDIKFIQIIVSKEITITHAPYIKMCVLDIENKDELLRVIKEYYNVLIK